MGYSGGPFFPDQGLPVFKRTTAVTACLITLGTLPAVNSFAAQLASFRATYDMNLVWALPVSGVTGVSGTFLLEQTVGCTGITLRQAVHLTIRDEGGGVASTRFAATVWERDDANEMTFSTVNEVAGGVVEAFNGRAVPQGITGAGRVDYTQPTAMTLALPVGVLFPVALTRTVLAAAGNGTQFLDVIGFDGGGPDTLNAVSVFVGAEFGPGEETPEVGAGVLADLRSWETRYAHFEFASPAPEPLFEVGYRLFENGVITNLILDYGGFQVSGTLEVLEGIAPAPC